MTIAFGRASMTSKKGVFALFSIYINKMKKIFYKGRSLSIRGYNFAVVI
jgi:hypothetical protein